MTTVLPPRGTRDFPPEIAILRQEVLQRIEKVYRMFGFDPIETPIVEYWEVLKGKYGEEAENKLIWRFKLPYSDREYALRYDLTVPLARFVARFRPRLPFKRYHIGRVYRYEEPQKGRYREFWQADFDIVGSKDPSSDAEVLIVVDAVFREFDFENYTIKVNDRRLLRGLFEERLGLDKHLILSVFRTIDKLDKIGLEGVIKELENKGFEKEIIDKIVEVISIQGKPEEVLDEVERKFGNIKEVSEAVQNLREILDFLPQYVRDRIKIDLSLVRGLDYYTGMVYEAVVDKPRIGSLSGGGRYDNLIGIFMGKDIPAVGGSIGVERLIDAGLELGLFKIKRKTYVQVAVVYVRPELYKIAWDIANRLRRVGYNVWIDLNREDFRRQIEYVVEKNIRWLVIVGPEDLKWNCVTVQDRYTRRKELVNLNYLEACAFY